MFPLLRRFMAPEHRFAAERYVILQSSRRALSNRACDWSQIGYGSLELVTYAESRRAGSEPCQII